MSADENMTDTEKEIYDARRFRRRAASGFLVGLLGLVGLGAAIYGLNQPSASTPLLELHTHPSCPHPECQIAHLGAKRQDIPDGMGTGLLSLAYLGLCGFIVMTVNQK